MAELSNFSDRELRKREGQAAKELRRLDALDGREVVRSGRADEVLSKMEAAGEVLGAVRGERARRERSREHEAFERALPARRAMRDATDEKAARLKETERRGGVLPCSGPSPFRGSSLVRPHD
jgi:hypothetical protein